MKVLYVIAACMLAAENLIEYFNNELIARVLIFRIILIFGNIICCVVWDKR